MNREEKFINYLEGLKTDGNAELLESISSGFKTLVEYRIGGTPAEKAVDIMESGEDLMTDDIAAEDPESLEDSVEDEVMAGDLDTPLDESIVKVREGLSGGTSTEENAADPEPVLEVGEGEVKGSLSPAILRAVDDEVEKKIQVMAQMIDRQKLTSNPEQKQQYLNHMRGQLWRDNLLDKGIDPAKAKGLMPAMNESIEDANAALLDFVDTAFKIFSIDKGE